MVQIGLVAGDARVDLLVPSLPALADDVWIGQQQPGHGNEVGAAVGQYQFDGGWGVDASFCAQAGDVIKK